MMKGNQVQRKSELVKHGPGDAHEKAKDRLVNILMDNGWECFPDAIFDVQFSLRSQEAYRLQKPESSRYYHEFDIYARKDVPIGGGGKYRLQSELIIEIDGTNEKGSHSEEIEKIIDLPNRKKKKQDNRDHTVEEYAAFFLRDARFIRIPIEHVLGRNKLIPSDEYIKNYYRLI